MQEIHIAYNFAQMKKCVAVLSSLLIFIFTLLVTLLITPLASGNDFDDPDQIISIQNHI